MIFPSADEQRCNQATNLRQQRDAFRISSHCHHKRRCRHHDHQRERRRLRKNAVVMPAGPQRQIKHRRAQRRDALRKIFVSLTEQPLAPGIQRTAQQQTNSDAPARPHPIVVECVFQKESRCKQQRQNPDVIQPPPGHQRLKALVALAICARGREIWNSRRRRRQTYRRLCRDRCGYEFSRLRHRGNWIGNRDLRRGGLRRHRGCLRNLMCFGQESRRAQRLLELRHALFQTVNSRNQPWRFLVDLAL